MPIYEYICLNCNEKFSLLQSLYPADRSTECPVCNSDKVKKVISSFCCAKSDSSSSGHAPSFGGGG